MALVVFLDASAEVADKYGVALTVHGHVADPIPSRAFDVGDVGGLGERVNEGRAQRQR